MLNDHSIILRKHNQGWRVVRLHVKEGYFFTPPKQFISPTWGPPPSCKQGLSVNLTLLQGWRNDRSTAPAITWTWFESREEAMWGWSLLMFVSLSVKAGFPRYKLFSEFPSSRRNLRPFPQLETVSKCQFYWERILWNESFSVTLTVEKFTSNSGKNCTSDLGVKKTEKNEIPLKGLLICFELWFIITRNHPSKISIMKKRFKLGAIAKWRSL